MTGIIQIALGLVIGGAGFHQIAANPIQGVCALFLAGFLIMIGLEKRMAVH
jgi:sulfite exporter TauE/SafE